MKKATAIILVLILSFGLFACGGGGPSIVGKWSMEVSEAGVTGKMIYEFTSDGKLFITVDTGNAENDKLVNDMFSEFQVTYEAKDGKLTLKSDNPELEPVEGVAFTIKDDKLSFDEYTLERMK
ncbi:MAG: lipocalin family protein [Bacillota bacterium]|nr:lipocalin family protein [Bacillota bacterium]